MPSIERDGMSTWYETLGSEDAPPVVLLHDAGADLRAWVPAARALAADYWLILVDLPGHGLSSGAEGAAPRGMAKFTSAVDAVLEDLGIELCAMAGLGLGALVALRMAMDGRDRIAAVVVGGRLDGVIRAPDEPAAREAEALEMGKRGALAVGRGRAREVRDTYLSGGITALYSGMQTDAVVEALRSIDAEGLTPADIARLQVPVLVATGDRDPGAVSGDRLAGLCEGARRVRIRDAGADAATTHAEAFAAQVRQFFRAVEEGLSVENPATR